MLLLVGLCFYITGATEGGCRRGKATENVPVNIADVTIPAGTRNSEILDGSEARNLNSRASEKPLRYGYLSIGPKNKGG